MPVQLIKGPSTKTFTREAAVRALKANKAFPEGAEFAIEEERGRWIAAIAIPEKTAGPFDGAPADSDEEAPGPKSEGPDDTAPADDSDGDDAAPKGLDDDKGDDDGGDKPHHEHGDKGKGESGELAQLMTLVHAIADALGISPDMGASPVPGLDDGMGPDGGPAGPPAPPHGHGGPPVPPPHDHPAGGPAGPPPPEKVMHEKSGPPPPTTFASVREDHPWAQMVGKVSHFTVAERIGDTPIAEVEAELQRLATDGFRIERLNETHDESGARLAEAIVKTPQVSQ